MVVCPACGTSVSRTDYLCECRCGALSAARQSVDPPPLIWGTGVVGREDSDRDFKWVFGPFGHYLEYVTGNGSLSFVRRDGTASGLLVRTPVDGDFEEVLRECLAGLVLES